MAKKKVEQLQQIDKNGHGILKQVQETWNRSSGIWTFRWNQKLVTAFQKLALS